MSTASARRKTRKLVAKIPSIKSLSRRNCPPGQIPRKAYKRHYSTAVRKTGFTVKKGSGKVYRVYPKNKNTHVQSRCIKNLGLPGKGSGSKKQIGPLKKGELARYGYSFRASDSQRHGALRKAVETYTALGVYRKLDAVAKLTEKTVPSASSVFAKDRNWVKESFGPLKKE